MLVSKQLVSCVLLSVTGGDEFLVKKPMLSAAQPLGVAESGSYAVCTVINLPFEMQI